LSLSRKLPRSQASMSVLPRSRMSPLLVCSGA
jgi:hypothetical protein